MPADLFSPARSHQPQCSPCLFPWPLSIFTSSLLPLPLPLPPPLTLSAQLLEEYEADPSSWAWPGPTRATAIVACLPAFMDASGHSTGGAAPMQRGASLATTQHVDPAAVIAVDDSSDEDDVPEGAVRFELDAAAIEEALAEDGVEIEARADVDVPDHLLPDEAVQQLVAERQPHFVAADGSPLPPAAAGAASTPGHNGVVQLRLSNGIKLNYRHTDNEPRGAMMRLVAAGGRATEGEGAGPLGTGVMALGTRTLSEAGTVGGWSREQVELYCISNLINCVLETDEEFVCMDFHFAVRQRTMCCAVKLGTCVALCRDIVLRCQLRRVASCWFEGGSLAGQAAA